MNLQWNPFLIVFGGLTNSGFFWWCLSWLCVVGINIVLASVLSAQHRLESFGKREPQLRKMSPPDWPVLEVEGPISLGLMLLDRWAWVLWSCLRKLWGKKKKKASKHRSSMACISVSASRFLSWLLRMMGHRLYNEINHFLSRLLLVTVFFIRANETYLRQMSWPKMT